MFRRDSHLNTEKYGGYTSANTACFAFIEIDGKKNTRQNLVVEIPIYVVNQARRDSDAIKNYLEVKKAYSNVLTKKYPIKKNALIISDGYPMRIRGVTKENLLFKNEVELVIKENLYETARKVEKYIDNSKDTGFDADPEFEKFTGIELNELYSELYQKLAYSIYKKRPANQAKTLGNGKEAFDELTLTKKQKLLIKY